MITTENKNIFDFEEWSQRVLNIDPREQEEFDRELRDFEDKRDKWISYLSSLSLNEPLLMFVNSLENKDTKDNYTNYINDFPRHGNIISIGPRFMTVAEFKESNIAESISRLSSVKGWMKATKDARISCFQSFCKYLEGISYCWFESMELIDVIYHIRDPELLKSWSSYYKRKYSLEDFSLLNRRVLNEQS